MGWLIFHCFSQCEVCLSQPVKVQVQLENLLPKRTYTCFPLRICNLDLKCGYRKNYNQKKANH